MSGDRLQCSVAIPKWHIGRKISSINFLILNGGGGGVQWGPWVGLWSVIVVFPDHTRLRFRLSPACTLLRTIILLIA